MKIKDFIRLFVPPIYYKIKHRMQKTREIPFLPLPKIVHEDKRMVVIGTGPSLNKTLELYTPQILESDCLMVNFSARTPLFEQIKPKYYIIADPGFITETKLKDSIDAFINDLITKTTWSMYLIMPDFLQQWYGYEAIRKNNNIKILFYNNKYERITSDEALFRAWDENRIGPPAQTVLNTAVWLSLYMGYKETYLVGADSSWLKDTYVDQIDNRVYTADTHYYNSDDVYKEKALWANNKRYLGVKFHEEIETLVIALRSYWELREYADWHGVKVYNASEYSCIDAFERKKLK